jgi:L-cysteine desulfidase
MSTRDQIVHAARTFVGVPWRHQGRSRMGIDCVGLLVAVAKIIGADHEDKLAYAHEPTNLEIVEHLRKYSTHHKIEKGMNMSGLIGIFAQSIYPCHVGIFTMKNGHVNIVHARADRKKVVEETFVNGSPGLGNLKELRGFIGADY